MLILIGKPSAAAASIPRNTRVTLNPSPFSLPAVVSSSESTDTFSRSRPAVRSAGASFSSSQPFVVSATSFTPTSCFRIRTSSGTSARSSGSPPVRRTLSTPSARNARTIRVSSPSVISCGSRRNG